MPQNSKQFLLRIKDPELFTHSKYLFHSVLDGNMVCAYFGYEPVESNIDANTRLVNADLKGILLKLWAMLSWDRRHQGTNREFSSCSMNMGHYLGHYHIFARYYCANKVVL